MTRPTIHEKKITLGIIIVWSTKFPARKNDTQVNFFKPVYNRVHRTVIFAIAQLCCFTCLWYRSGAMWCRLPSRWHGRRRQKTCRENVLTGAPGCAQSVLYLSNSSLN